LYYGIILLSLWYYFPYIKALFYQCSHGVPKPFDIRHKGFGRAEAQVKVEPDRHVVIVVRDEKVAYCLLFL